VGDQGEHNSRSNADHGVATAVGRRGWEHAAGERVRGSARWRSRAAYHSTLLEENVRVARLNDAVLKGDGERSTCNGGGSCDGHRE
jgi:hypothetical protein